MNEARQEANRELEAETVRGAQGLDLSRPSGEFLAEVPWGGLAPDPDTTDAATFLAWL